MKNSYREMNPHRTSFEPNQRKEPTLLSVTNPAGQDSRHTVARLLLVR
jgi:hypothetical protein